jgi:hypothetical protein
VTTAHAIARASRTTAALSGSCATATTG